MTSETHCSLPRPVIQAKTKTQAFYTLSLLHCIPHELFARGQIVEGTDREFMHVPLYTGKYCLLDWILDWIWILDRIFCFSCTKLGLGRFCYYSSVGSSQTTSGLCTGLIARLGRFSSYSYYSHVFISQ